MSIRQYLKKKYLYLTEFKWTIGIMDYSDAFIFDRQSKPQVRWVRTAAYKSGWFADPFIWSESEDVLEILAEEYVYASRKAHISLLTVNKETMELVSVRPVLSQACHLSFPAIRYEGTESFIYPESVHAGVLSLFRYDSSHQCFKKVRTLCNAPLADAIITDLGDQTIIMGTRYPRDNGNELEIHEFYEGDCQEIGKPLYTVRFEDDSARNAGAPFLAGGKLIRPAQNSNSFYGECLVFQEMKLVDGWVRFDEIKRVYSPNRKYPLSFHTFNVFHNKYAAVDAQGFRSGYLGLLLYRIRETLRK